MSSLKSISLFFPTVRHLRSKQIKARLRNRLSPLFVNTERFCLQAVPEFRGCSWSPRLGFLPPAEQNNSAPDLITGKFCFLNNKQELGWPPVWTPARLPKLWIYNLHYFDYLWFLDYVQAKSVVLDWIEKYGLRAENIGWQPYPTSCRLINFCAVFFGKYRQQTEADRAFLRKLWESIYIQAQWLSRNFEIHLLGNHLFENAAALAFAGSCFSGTAADKWFQVGTHILEKEIQEQILDDGMHFERSPMYHCRIA